MHSDVGPRKVSRYTLLWTFVLWLGLLGWCFSWLWLVVIRALQIRILGRILGSPIQSKKILGRKTLWIGALAMSLNCKSRMAGCL